ncbi:UDP-N-acetylmuramate--L-alanine ligase, partial [Candidatus Dependentiae bacterium]|nr:UDP-N-acetylmuramate--L-alanine ligase [Candidatus Dependentiae bacterium]MCG2756622.1 UDP-N-acetylmuramate--L-alanine ligase [Candidatus Dependentiae bacterium]
MSGLAEILKLQGYNISGCDKDTNSSIIEHLKSIGCSIYQNHNTEHITNADVLVCTTAINKSNEEVNTALQKNIPVVHRSLILAELMRTKYSIAVSGAHGKTTTTSMISHILLESNIDPTIIVGGILKTISKNAHFGKSDFLVAEADESDRSFLNLYPTLAVITNIDKEHLETYKDLEDIKQTFIKFLNKLPFFGKAFLCIDNENVKSLLPIKNINAITYGFTQDANIMGEIIETTANGSTFNIYFNKNFIGQMNLNIAGRHNVLNALASIGIALELDIPLKKIQDALKTFKGVVRRFEFKGTYNKA